MSTTGFDGVLVPIVALEVVLPTETVEQFVALVDSDAHERHRIRTQDARSAVSVVNFVAITELHDDVLRGYGTRRTAGRRWRAGTGAIDER